jgi:hypothetical protein
MWWCTSISLGRGFLSGSCGEPLVEAVAAALTV